MGDITLSLLLLQLMTGIALGAVYALLALGLSLIFGMLRVVNFAHGAFFMVGAFLGVYFTLFLLMFGEESFRLFGCFNIFLLVRLIGLPAGQISDQF